MDRIIDLMKTKHTSLFLGAGSSIPLGGPSGGELLNYLKKHYSDIEFSYGDNFFDVCKDIIDSGKYSRIDLQTIIFRYLNGLFPNEQLIDLVNLPWKTIFTTNYDVVIERIPEERLKNKIINVIKENHPKIKFNKIGLLNYIKILGSIDRPYREEGYPILTRTEFTTSFERRRMYYYTLTDCIREGSIIFIGYSFRDNLVFEIFEEILETTGINALRESYAIIPGSLDDKTRRMFEKFHIIHIKGTLDEFIKNANEQFLNYDFTSIPSEKILHVLGFPIEVPMTLENQCEEYFSILDQHFTISAYNDIKKFYNGEDSSYYPFLQNWDFQREIYTFNGALKPQLCKLFGDKVKDGIKNRIFRDFLDPSPENNSRILLTGPAGSGKTIILKRLAFDWYTKGQPVVFIRPKGPTLDYILLDSFIEHVEKYIKKNKFGTSISRPRFLIICDNCGQMFQEYDKMYKHLTSRGKLITVVLSDRENRISKKIKNNLLTYTIPESFSSDELKEFVEYILTQKIADTVSEIIPFIENPRYNESFFALMYSIVDESKRPLNQIIRDQFVKLEGWAKIIYEYVCVFNNYKCNLPENLLVRSTVNSWPEFRDNLLKNELNKVIFPIDAENDEIDYRVHHPIIAEKTVDFFSDSKAQKLIELINKINPNYDHEVRAIEYILVKEIGPNTKERSIPLQAKKDIFKIACSIIGSRSLYHHYGLLEMEGPGKDFDHAEQLLTHALQEVHGHEPIQNIYTSFGSLNLKRGHELFNEGKTDDAIIFYDKAIHFFILGRSRRHFDEHSYHGQIVVLIKKASISKDRIEKVKLLSDALNLCEEAISVLKDANRTRFVEEKGKIFLLLDKIEKFEEIVQILIKNFKSAAGLRIKAIKKYNEISTRIKDEKITDLSIFTEDFKSILKIIEQGLDVDPQDSGLILLKLKVIFRLYPDDETQQFDILKQWYDFTDHQNIKYLFNYGILLFKKERYKTSKDVFKELESISEGEMRRSYIKKGVFFTKNKEIMKFRGVVTSVDMYKRVGFIRCDTLPNYPTEIKFFPKYLAQENDHVVFNIGFNMRGPIGENVTKY